VQISPTRRPLRSRPWSLEDLEGNELCKIQERKLRVKDSMEIEGPGGDRLALVKKAMVTPGRDAVLVLAVAVAVDTMADQAD
jgi:uncharacterized protein YxjI